MHVAMPVEIRYYTDPACSWSWGSEPKLRLLQWEFGDQLAFRWVMGGLARSFGADYRDSAAGITGDRDCFDALMAHWLDVGVETGMPVDPRIWRQAPLASTYPVCQAVKAATEQGPAAAGGLPAAGARGDLRRAPQARPRGRPDRGGGRRRPRLRAFRDRPRLARDHRGVRGRPRRGPRRAGRGARAGPGRRDRGPRAGQLSLRRCSSAPRGRGTGSGAGSPTSATVTPPSLPGRSRSPTGARPFSRRWSASGAAPPASWRS